MLASLHLKETVSAFTLTLEKKIRMKNNVTTYCFMMIKGSGSVLLPS